MNLVELAQRIRQLRIQRDMTLEEVAGAIGQTRSWLSRVENFRITPSLPALSGIAKTLGVTTARLLDGLDEEPMLICVRKREGVIVERDVDSQIVYRSLASARPNRTMDPFILSVPPGEERDARSHEGEEFLFVTKGKVQFLFDDERYVLKSGDSLYFDSEVNHCLANPYEKEAEVLCVFRLGRSSGRKPGGRE